MLRFIFCLFIECFMIFRAVLSHRCFAFCSVLKWIFNEMLSYEKGKQAERRRVERKTNLNLQQREKKVLWKELLFNLFYENLIFPKLFLLGSRVEDRGKEKKWKAVRKKIWNVNYMMGRVNLKLPLLFLVDMCAQGSAAFPQYFPSKRRQRVERWKYWWSDVFLRRNW